MGNSQKCTFGRFYGGPEKMAQKAEAVVKKFIRGRIFVSIVLIVVNYLDDITIIFLKFKALVTSITGNVIDVSKTLF